MHPAGNLVADTICRTAEIGLTITDAADAGTVTVINADPVEIVDICPNCAMTGVTRDHIQRRLVDLPVVGFPTRLHVRVPRFTCTNESCSRKCQAPGFVEGRLSVDQAATACLAVVPREVVNTC